ncbi:DUF1801 domain-containing protein [Helcobacillus massiliensis]|uniref:Uncharacterized protein YdhG (YjbR/CyaY superfamily) n=1 Tax=Helcobacillus massiliensis TaxID=521392 RepID=A0A839QQE8_9MICO|nr:DUF1801 domain-containing protein [Helcobacillus massiliensis]MBB3022723.1 uncharacterized protein YdhG (YjbR/CyaY superfamily) [Helcobacillus massiliensis]
MTDETFSAAERAAMTQAAAERKAFAAAAKKGGTRAGRAAAKRAAELTACTDAIAALPESDRAIAEAVHEIVFAEVEDVRAKTWYGFPAYHLDGPVIAFVQPASKFGTRYCTLGFNDGAQLDDGAMWPTSFAVLEVNDEVRERITAQVRTAFGA